MTTEVFGWAFRNTQHIELWSRTTAAQDHTAWIWCKCLCIHPGLYQRSRWCNGVNDIFGILCVPTKYCLKAAAYLSIVVDHLHPFCIMDVQPTNLHGSITQFWGQKGVKPGTSKCLVNVWIVCSRTYLLLWTHKQCTFCVGICEAQSKHKLSLWD